MFASLCLCCQGPAIASVEEDGYSECTAELELGLETDVSALPDVVMLHRTGESGQHP